MKINFKAIVTNLSLTCLCMGFLVVLSCFSGKEDKEQKSDEMVWISFDTFKMGSNDSRAYPPEKPAHNVSVKGFWMDKTEVTNAQFKEFVDATDYITVAERALNWEELKHQAPEGAVKPADSLLVPGSIVFIPPKDPVNPTNPSLWWHWVPRANWKHPEGSQSNLVGRWKHPVVHIAFEDALAYAKWKEKRLPTEAEWELAAQSNISKDPWKIDASRNFANTFQGVFPYYNSKKDGFLKTAPVMSFPPNKVGLYDVIGNVWEWTSDWYSSTHYTTLDTARIINNPTGSKFYYDPREPYTPKRVIKGGSFLCSNQYCSNYRTSSRQGSAIDTGTSNVGFRCVKDELKN